MITAENVAIAPTSAFDPHPERRTNDSGRAAIDSFALPDSWRPRS